MRSHSVLGGKEIVDTTGLPNGIRYTAKNTTDVGDDALASIKPPQPPHRTKSSALIFPKARGLVQNRR